MDILELFRVAFVEDGPRLLLAIALGGAIGFEREFRDKPAGFRTNVLICLGATLFTVVSVRAGEQAGFDQARIAAQVVTGVGFLGAGTILHHRGNVLGLTTAATIWMVAALGTTIGLGASHLATIAALLVMLVLFGLRQLEGWFDRSRRIEVLRATAAPGDESAERLHALVSESAVDVRWSKHTRQGDTHKYQWKIVGAPGDVEALLARLLDSADLTGLDY